MPDAVRLTPRMGLFRDEPSLFGSSALQEREMMGRGGGDGMWLGGLFGDALSWIDLLMLP